jgi:hypothetical protein
MAPLIGRVRILRGVTSPPGRVSFSTSDTSERLFDTATDICLSTLFCVPVAQTFGLTLQIMLRQIQDLI